MKNLLSETLSVMNSYGKTPLDVEWVGSYSCWDKPEYWTTWEVFAAHADVEYDDGFGGNEVDLGLVVVGADWWLERHEYDGSEWWGFKTLPKKPNARNNTPNLMETEDNT